MNSIGIFEFRDLFSNVKSAAFVGSSSSVLLWNNGKIIDSYDMVIRFNRAHIRGIEEKVGKTTTVLVANELNNIDFSPAPSEILNPKCIVTFVKPKANLDIKPLKKWVGDIPHLITLAPDIVETKSVKRTRSLTMGTYSLYTFLRLFQFEKIFVTGFTMYGQSLGGGAQYYNKEYKEVGWFHDFNQEAIIFSQILRQYNGELTMTEEVKSLT